MIKKGNIKRGKWEKEGNGEKNEIEKEGNKIMGGRKRGNKTNKAVKKGYRKKKIKMREEIRLYFRGNFNLMTRIVLIIDF